MKQYEERNGKAAGLFGFGSILAFAIAVLLALVSSGCQGGDRQAILAGELPDSAQPDQTERPYGLRSVEPSDFLPGDVVELHGYGFPTDTDLIRVRFSRIGGAGTRGILGSGERKDRM